MGALRLGALRLGALGRWLASGSLLMVAGALTAVSTWRHWTPCRAAVSSMVCRSLQEETVGPPVWAAAGHRDPGGTALAGVAAVLLALAWFAASGWARGNAARRGLAAFVGLQPLLIALLVGLELLAPGQALVLITCGWLSWPAEMVIFPLLLGAGWVIEERPLPLLRLLLLGWGATSLGPLHHFSDYVWSRLLWPGAAATPPNLGYVTAVTQVVLGAAVLVISLLLARPEPKDDDEMTGRDGFTLAA